MSEDLLQTPPPEEAAGPVWHLLREAREARGLSVSEVAQHLKFTPKQVEAMEAGALDTLPGAAFARGFVRNYARFLQLDPQLFLAGMGAAPTTFEGMPAQTPPLGSMPRVKVDRASLRAMLISAGLLALVATGWYFGWFEAREEQLIAEDLPAELATTEPQLPAALPVDAAPAASAPFAAESAPVAESSAPVVASASAPAAQQSAPIAQGLPAIPSPQALQSAPAAQSAPRALVAVAGQKRVQLSFKGESWVEVRDADGNVLLSRLNTAGSTQEVQGKPPLSLVIGNARDVSVSVEGRAFDLQPHIRVDVARINIE